MEVDGGWMEGRRVKGEGELTFSATFQIGEND